MKCKKWHRLLAGMSPCPRVQRTRLPVGQMVLTWWWLWRWHLHNSRHRLPRRWGDLPTGCQRRGHQWTLEQERLIGDFLPVWGFCETNLIIYTILDFYTGCSCANQWAILFDNSTWTCKSMLMLQLIFLKIVIWFVEGHAFHWIHKFRWSMQL
jgi:hypothetical protein